MKLNLMVPLIAITSVPGFGESPRTNAHLSVRVLDYVNLSLSDRHEMEDTAERVFRSARIPIVFVECYTGGAETGGEACNREPGSADLFLRIFQPKMAVKGEQLGYAAMTPEGGAYVTVFINPQQQKARVAGLTNGALVGYAAAHEIGHLLLGPNSHSSVGIMRPVWRPVDEEWMVKRALFFDSGQSRAMQKAVAERLTR
jgi:hypothetical protein